MMGSPGSLHRVLIIVKNLPSPLDRLVWQEATKLHKNGYQVAIICPKGKGYRSSYELIEGVHIYRHWLPAQADGTMGYLLEYSAALFFEFYLAFKILVKHGFDVIHACHPPENIFLVGRFFRFFGKRFLFDYHDITLELYEAKFSRRDIFYKTMLLWEKLTFRLAHVSIAANESYKSIAVKRGGMPEDKVFVVRSGSDLKRLRAQGPVESQMSNKSTMKKIMDCMGLEKPVVQYDLLEGRRSALEASLYAARNDEADFADKILDLIDNPSKRKEMGQFGMTSVESKLELRREEPKLLAPYDCLFSQ